MSDSAFIIRVYGIYIHQSQYVLISDEIAYEKFITKFPGGGLIAGEGTIDCLKREMKEETGIDFEVSSHFYTTDFFMESAFHPGRQIISIYYRMFPTKEINYQISETPYQFSDYKTNQQSFRFLPIELLIPEHFTFSIDQHVAGLLANTFKNL
jgi:ADP-ribose pyrophosphatase YjhB (NUDIX family)